MWSSREDSEEKSPPAEAPAPGPAERKSTTNGDDARPAGLLHEPHELSTSTLTKLSNTVLVRITSMWAFRVLA